jgi:hypothetical protein
MRLPSILRSSIFRLTVKSAISFLISALVALGIIGGLYLASELLT